MPSKASSEEIPSPSATLLRLPYEIRQNIYRNVLLFPRPLGRPSGYRHSVDDDLGWIWLRGESNNNSPFCILLVCHSMYAEGSAILYGENTFAFKIYDGKGEECADFPSYDHIDQAEESGFPIEKVKRYVIKVEVPSNEEYPIVRSSVRRVCKVLAATPKLSFIHIQIELCRDDTEDWLHSVIRPFSVLRNIKEVIIEGYREKHIFQTDLWDAVSQQASTRSECHKLFMEKVKDNHLLRGSYMKQPFLPVEVARELKELMEGDSSKGLYKMYDVLHDYASQFREVDDLLLAALESAENGDAESFKRRRAKIIAAIDDHIASTKPRIFAHDNE